MSGKIWQRLQIFVGKTALLKRGGAPVHYRQLEFDLGIDDERQTTISRAGKREQKYSTVTISSNVRKALDK